MTSVAEGHERHAESPLPVTAARPAPAAGTGWGNAAPLGLAAFAVTTFILSLVNTGVVSIGIEPVAFGVAFMYGGLVQLIAGVICFRNGNTFNGVLFSTFGAFWLSLYAIAEYFLKSIPAADVGHALGIFLFAFAIPTLMLLVASFRTNVVVVTALTALFVTLVVLGAGNYQNHAATPNALMKIGGWLGLLAAVLAVYLACAEVCEFTYGRAVLPLGPLTRK